MERPEDENGFDPEGERKSQPEGTPQQPPDNDELDMAPERVTDKETLRQRWKDTSKEIVELGGWQGFKSGAWLLKLIRKSFGNYYERANAEYFREKYPRLDTDAIVKKLTSVASRNSAILGGVVGAAVSTNEILALLTATAGGVSLPANVAIAFAAIAAEAVLLVRMQLQLVANVAKLYGVPLDPEDPEDILTILAFAAGGSVAEVAGKAGMKIGGRLTEKAVRRYVSKQVLVALKSVGRKLGIKILQRTIIKYAVPVASMAIGAGWNYVATRAVGRIAKKHFIASALKAPPPDADAA